MKNKILISLLVSLILLSGISVAAIASAGVGVSPAKIVLQIDGGEAYETELLIFNTGTYELEINVVAEGDIAEFTTIEPVTEVIQPEPMPHEFPIKNGKTFKVTFNPPAESKTIKYVGSLDAIGNPSPGSQFGGSVGVGCQVELTVIPPKSIFSYLTLKHFLVIAGIILFLLIYIFFKKSGLKFQVVKKSAEPSQSPKQ